MDKETYLSNFNFDSIKSPVSKSKNVGSNFCLFENGTYLQLLSLRDCHHHYNPFHI